MANARPPHIFISYARADDEAFVSQLRDDLVREGITVWWDRVSMESRGKTFFVELRDAIEAADRVLAVIGPGAVASPYVQSEWEHAALFSKAVLPVLRKGDYSLAPPDIADLPGVDFRPQREPDVAFRELVRMLREPVAPLAPLPGVPALPKYFTPRRSDIARLSDVRVDTLAERAQKDKPFTHAFSPHCLRHTFAIQHINVGTDVKLISKWLGHGSVAVTLEHYGNWIKETQKLAEDVSRDANAKMNGQGRGATESHEHRPDELFGYTSGNLITLSSFVQLFRGLHQPLPYPLMGVADQFPKLSEGGDVWNPGENHIQRCLFVVDEGLVSGCLLWLCLNASLHARVTYFIRCVSSLRLCSSCSSDRTLTHVHPSSENAKYGLR